MALLGASKPALFSDILSVIHEHLLQCNVGVTMNIETHIGDYQLSVETADSSPPTEAPRVAVGLPTNQQATLVGQPEGNCNAAACCAYRIYEVAPQPPLASVTPNIGSTALLQGTKDLSRQAAALSTVPLCQLQRPSPQLQEPVLQPTPLT
jgi:hypothetical protein